MKLISNNIWWCRMLQCNWALNLTRTLEQKTRRLRGQRTTPVASFPCRRLSTSSSISLLLEMKLFLSGPAVEKENRGTKVNLMNGSPWHWYSRKRGFHVYYTLSNFSSFTPNNTWYTKYTFFFFFSKLRGKKRVIGVEQSVPIKSYVIGVSGNSKSCLGLGYTETCDTIRCHLKTFDDSYWNSFLPFFLSANGKHKKCFRVRYDDTHTFDECNQALTGNP